MSNTPSAAIRNIFFAGLAVVLPLAFTVFVLRFVFVSVDAWLSPHMTMLLIAFGAPLEPEFRIPGLGLVATVALVFFAGLLTRNIVGRKLYEFGESLLVRIPIFKNVYGGAKQVMDTLGASSSRAFRKAILIEYPRKGVYALAFITGDSSGEVDDKTEKHMLNVFLPTTPNPTSGFFLLVPEDEIIELEMSVESAVKLIISAGILTPNDAKKASNGTTLPGAQ